MVESLLILVDSSIAEIFVNGGEIVFTTRIYLEKAERIWSFAGAENINWKLCDFRTIALTLLRQRGRVCLKATVPRPFAMAESGKMSGGIT